MQSSLKGNPDVHPLPFELDGNASSTAAYSVPSGPQQPAHHMATGNQAAPSVREDTHSCPQPLAYHTYTYPSPHTTRTHDTSTGISFYGQNVSPSVHPMMGSQLPSTSHPPPHSHSHPHHVGYPTHGMRLMPSPHPHVPHPSLYLHGPSTPSGAGYSMPHVMMYPGTMELSALPYYGSHSPSPSQHPSSQSQTPTPSHSQSRGLGGSPMYPHSLGYLPSAILPSAYPSLWGLGAGGGNVVASSQATARYSNNYTQSTQGPTPRDVSPEPGSEHAKRAGSPPAAPGAPPGGSPTPAWKVGAQVEARWGSRWLKAELVHCYDGACTVRWLPGGREETLLHRDIRPAAPAATAPNIRPLPSATGIQKGEGMKQPPASLERSDVSKQGKEQKKAGSSGSSGKGGKRQSSLDGRGGDGNVDSEDDQGSIVTVLAEEEEDTSPTPQRPTIAHPTSQPPEVSRSAATKRKVATSSVETCAVTTGSKRPDTRMPWCDSTSKPVAIPTISTEVCLLTPVLSREREAVEKGIKAGDFWLCNNLDDQGLAGGGGKKIRRTPRGGSTSLSQQILYVTEMVPQLQCARVRILDTENKPLLTTLPTPSPSARGSKCSPAPSEDGVASMFSPERLLSTVSLTLAAKESTTTGAPPDGTMLQMVQLRKVPESALSHVFVIAE